MAITAYQLVETDDILIFNGRISQLLRQGWALWKAPCVVALNNGTIWRMQAMVIFEQSKEEEHDIYTGQRKR